ncbi:hypothetical protein EJ110_NYTH01881 [Nymphaea thermarum]|nr:hypothetical protein EJ110_NYTH01881 [Nymphaea thermarum]
MKSPCFVAEAAEIGEIFAQYGLEPHEYALVVAGLRKRPQAWVDFMMKFELGLEKPEPRRAIQSALTISIAYAVGGLVPLSPYMFISVSSRAMVVSVAVTLVALLLFGYVKGSLTGSQPIKSSLQMAIIGAIASAAAYGMAKVVTA